MLLFDFKNRRFQVDCYGLVKNTVLIPTHTWSPSQLPRSKFAQALQAPWQRLGPRQFQKMQGCFCPVVCPPLCSPSSWGSKGHCF